MITNIYILELVERKWYVGKSLNPEKRFIEHVDGKGSLWTKKYKPLKIEKIISLKILQFCLKFSLL